MSLKILAIDTATTACSVAVQKDGRICATAHEDMARGQSEVLMPMVMAVLAETTLSVSDMDLIAVTRGPGAFTGVRIGLAAARGLALAAGVPSCGVSTTQVIAEAARQTNTANSSLIVALDSKRSDIYVQAFGRTGEILTEPVAVAIDALLAYYEALALCGPVQLVGDAADRALSRLPASCVRSRAPDVPDAQYVAKVAERLVLTGMDMPEPTPLYLRPPDASVPKNGGRLRP